MEIQPGDRLGKYQIVERLGRGGQAEVFKASPTPPGPFVAIKILRSAVAAEEDFVRRFEREAAIIASLNHPQIVKVYDFVSAGERPYMVMEYIEGETLEARLRRLRKAGSLLPMDEVLRIFDFLAPAVDYAHNLGMIHRDLKPSNIIFRANDQPVLMDFGVARILGAARFTQSGMLVGTPAYMAPEQCQGEGGDQRSDLYALGVMLFEMVCGQQPFSNDNPYGMLMMHINTRPPQPRSLNPQLSLGVEQVLLQALAKKPEERCASAQELARALHARLQQDLTQELAAGPLAAPLAAPLAETLASPAKTPLQTGRYPARLGLPAPFQAPPEVARFVGRSADLEALRGCLSAGQRPPVCALVGMGGIGKTALAVHLAHDLQPRFGGGVLWANLASSDPLAVLDSWARAFGCDFSSLPDLSSRAAALRGVLYGEPVLFILDDVPAAMPSEVVRRLLVGGPGSAALLTTRSLEVAAAHNARIFSLGVLEAAQSLELVSQIAGSERVQGELRAAKEICALLGHLPLAVEIAAQRLASHRSLGLAEFCARLKDEQGRLAELRLSDREVRASFAVSYQVLEPGRQRAFQFLGVFGGRAFTPPALAAVGMFEKFRAEDHLFALEAVSLVQAAGAAHYRQHPLLADFAHELLGPDQMAELRMINYYLKFARDHAGDSKTLEEEEENLAASLRAAYQQQAWKIVLAFSQALKDYWFVRGRYGEARQGYRWADEAARKLNGGQGDAEIYFHWGRACMEQKDYAEAEERLRQSLQLYTALGQPQGVAANQVHLARIALERGSYEEAQALLDDCQRIRAALNDQAGLAEVLYTSARIAYFRGSMESATQAGRQALMIQYAENDEQGAILSLNLLASVAFELEKYPLADDFARQSLDLCDKTNNMPDRVQPLLILGDVRRKQERMEEAVEFFAISLDLLKKIGDLELQAEALYSLSKAYLAKGESGPALEAAQKSLALCETNSAPLLMIYVLVQLGDVHQKLGQPAAARQHWTRAHDLAESIQAAQGIKVARSRLDAAG